MDNSKFTLTEEDLITYAKVYGLHDGSVGGYDRMYSGLVCCINVYDWIISEYHPFSNRKFTRCISN